MGYLQNAFLDLFCKHAREVAEETLKDRAVEKANRSYDGVGVGKVYGSVLGQRPNTQPNMHRSGPRR